MSAMSDLDIMMSDAAWEALDMGWPFSSLETRMVRYLGKDRRIIRMAVDQIFGARK